MSKINNRQNILHHSGNLTIELKQFLEKSGYQILTIENYQNEQELGYIIIGGDEEIDIVCKAFHTLDKDIRLISLGYIKNFQHFLSGNGRLIIDPKTVNAQIHQISLEKYFQGKASVYLDENFPDLKDFFNFKITNHLRIGHEIDRMSLFAFEKNFNPVNMRGYMDSLVYYLTYLKQSGVACIPFEVDYGATSNELMVQVHLHVKNYVAEYLLDSFGTPNSQDPVKYLLSQCAQMADFLEIQYIEKVAKIVITGIWRKRVNGKRDISDFNGLMIHQVQTAKQVVDRIRLELMDTWVSQEKDVEGRLDRLKEKLLPGHFFEILFSDNYQGYFKEKPAFAQELESFTIDNFKPDRLNPTLSDISISKIKNVLGDYSNQDEVLKLKDTDWEHLQQRIQKRNFVKALENEAQVVRGNLEDNQSYVRNLKDRYTKEVSQKIAGSLNEAQIETIVAKGLKTNPESETLLSTYLEEDEAFVVSGSGPDGQPAIKVTGKTTEDDFIQKISGSVKEQIKNQLIKGSPVEKDDFVMRISSALSDQIKGQDKDKAYFLSSGFQEKVKALFSMFATKNGFDPNKAKEEHFKNFLSSELSSIIKPMVSFESNFNLSEDDFLKIPELALKRQFNRNIKSELDLLVKEKKTLENSEDEYRKVIEATLKKSMEETLALNQLKTNNEKETIELARVIGATVVSDHPEAIIPFIGEAKVALAQVEKAEIEKAMTTQSSFYQEGASGGALAPGMDTIESNLYRQLKTNETDITKLKGQLDAAKLEIRVLKDTKNQILQSQHSSNGTHIEKPIPEGNVSNVPREDLEQSYKRLKLEMVNKESFLGQELEKSNRMIRSRDLVIEKAKDNFKQAIENKDKEIRDLNKKLISLARIESMDKRNDDNIKTKELEWENNNLKRQLDVYKTKLNTTKLNTTLKSAANDNTKAQNSNQHVDARALMTEKTHVENQLQNLKRDYQRLENKLKQEQMMVQELKNENKRINQEMNSPLTLKEREEINKAPMISSQSNLEIDSKGAKISHDLKEANHKISRYQSQVQNLEFKVSELTQKLAYQSNSKADANGAQSKNIQMEAILKKVTQDFKNASQQLADAKKEVQKTRSEKVALTNEIEKLKKDLEKFRPSGPAKKGSKAA
jgi:hypothetical protein